MTSTCSRKLDVHHVAVDHLDDLRESVRPGQLLRDDGNRGPLHRVDAGGACARGEHAQDAAARSDVENDVAGTYH